MLGMLWLMTTATSSFGSMPLEHSPVDRMRSFYRFKSEHRQITRSGSESPFNVTYTPREFKSELARVRYFNRTRRAVGAETEIIDRVAEAGKFKRTRFETYDISNLDEFIDDLPAHFKGYVKGELLQQSQFKKMHRALPATGMWIVYRAYSWEHLEHPGMAGPHMSIIIGNRVYEVGRRLKKENGVPTVTTEGRAGPIASNLNEFLLKSRLESQALGARPGISFAVRIAGVGERPLKALADYYENEAKDFKTGKKRFKYVMNPGARPDADNCVTYLTRPILDKRLTRGIDLMAALALPRYTTTPFTMLGDAMNEHFERPKVVKAFMISDDDAWRKQLDDSIPADGYPTISDPAFPDYDEYWAAEDAHPQLSASFFWRLRFQRGWTQPATVLTNH